MKPADIAKECMARVMMAQEYIKAVEGAAYYINSINRYAKIDYGSIRDQLINLELAAWRDLAMWGLVVDKDIQDRIKAAAHDRFLRNGMSVSWWLNNGVEPGQWLDADEVTFRKMAADAFLKNNHD